MAVTRAKKSETLKELVEKFGRSKTVVFSEYRGLEVKDISELRKRLRKADSECKVAKKTLIRIAAKENKLEDIGDAQMQGPVAVIFSYGDALSGLQIVYKFSKENDKIKLIGGFIDGKLMDADMIKRYATIPSREELIAKFMGSAQAPVANFVGVLSALMGGLTRVVKAYGEKKAKEGN